MPIKKTTKATAKKKAVATPQKTVSPKVKSNTKPKPKPTNQTIVTSSPFWNIWDTGTQYKIRVLASKLSKKNIKVQMEGNNLIISCEKDKTAQKTEKNYIIHEYHYDSWTKSVNLPQKANPESLKVNYKDGVLKITIDKQSTAK